jgi:hypothetical protein
MKKLVIGHKSFTKCMNMHGWALSGQFVKPSPRSFSSDTGWWTLKVLVLVLHSRLDNMCCSKFWLAQAQACDPNVSLFKLLLSIRKDFSVPHPGGSAFVSFPRHWLVSTDFHRVLLCLLIRVMILIFLQPEPICLIAFTPTQILFIIQIWSALTIQVSLSLLLQHLYSLFCLPQFSK